ncbi:hypothetical protein IFM89_015654 [Coptis chinensis]|uniref:Protein CYCLOPS n=1 Tax=Coptis chinensis TaxID=261450 RepID=A0A835IWD5_9MAGN|nr:hypothetical protein IFM89_015654 [Coptis chinensis]
MGTYVMTTFGFRIMDTIQQAGHIELDKHLEGRLSTELASLTSQQRGSNEVLFTQNLPMVDELSSEQNQGSLRSTPAKGMQATNLYLAKAWFHSSQPMTRSRSSELRRRYAAMQNVQTSIGMEATRDASGHDISRMKQDFATTSNFCDVSMIENPNQLETFMSPSNSSTSPFKTSVPTVDTVSSVVSMLKGTLERKKLTNHVDKQNVEGSSFEFYSSQEVLPNMSFIQGPSTLIFEPPGTFQAESRVEVKEFKTSEIAEEHLEIDIDGPAPANPVQISTVSQEPSQSESSAAAPAPSAGFEVCDGPSISGQNPSVSENSRKQVCNGSSEYTSKAKELRERILENNLKDDRKKGSLVRMGSVTSGGSGDKGDPTKKRRVERSRKMAEAKERNMTPAVSVDMQSMLKRCENLEKEVRSLKLNLSFMNSFRQDTARSTKTSFCCLSNTYFLCCNGLQSTIQDPFHLLTWKDSEQTKQIEDLQKQNEELVDEKERLLEEIERILSETSKM